MQNRVMEWCPDVSGSCIGSQCAAYGDEVTCGVNDASFFINKVIPEIAIDKIPLLFGLDISFCKKYNVFIDQESKDIFEMFTSEIINVEGEINES